MFDNIELVSAVTDDPIVIVVVFDTLGLALLFVDDPVVIAVV